MKYYTLKLCCQFVEKLLERKSSGSGLKSNITAERDPTLLYPAKNIGTNFADKRRSLGRSRTQATEFISLL
jgi:hypothetical protein